MPLDKVDTQVDFPALERQILQFWDTTHAFEKLRDKNRGKPKWSFLDGPITANDPMGVHHAWGRTYKDAYNRYFAMTGHELRYQNGFDCQGLWVEVEVEKELKLKTKRDIEALVPGDRFASIDKFVEECKARVNKFARVQTEQSIRLGYWMDWDLSDADWAKKPGERKSYFTMSEENNYTIWAFLKKCFDRKLVYKSYDAMPWCGRCGTGISQMEMNEGYHMVAHRSVFVKFPLLDASAGTMGENLLVWTTTPWTLSSNVGAAVNPKLTYLKVKHKDEIHYLAKGAFTAQRLEEQFKRKEWVDGVPKLKSVEQIFKEKGGYEIVGELLGAELVGRRYRGPYDDLPAQQHPFGFPEEIAVVVERLQWGPKQSASEIHRVVAWEDVGETEGTGIVHIAPGCGAEDYQLGKAVGLPVIGPIDEDGRYYRGFDWLTGMDAPNAAESIVSDLEQRGFFYHLEPYSHRYPHCWRCSTPLLFRLVDEWYISMGPVYDRPRDQLTPAEVDASLRYQIMEVVDGIRWIPDFGYERELDWLINMRDWMISKKRYYGLALPIYDCKACGHFDVMGGREELKARAVAGWDAFEGHTPHRPHIDEVRIACSSCGEPVSRIADVGNPWLDAGIVPFSTLHFREDPEFWAKWFPADFITESFPGQFRNWFYAMLAMSTVLRREEPFRTIFGYATLFGEDGRPMHKSWGNAIEFNEAADRMGVDVMRWMYARQRPEDNILFGYHAADDVRRELLVLWNVVAFFVTYARLGGWSTDRPVVGAVQVPDGGRTAMDRWILSRVAGLAVEARTELADFDARAATQAISTVIDDLSTWYLRRSRRRFSRSDDAADRAAAFGTLHLALVSLARITAPILPFLADELHAVLVTPTQPDAPASVHLTAWPDAELAPLRDPALEAAMADLRRAVELGRTLRGQAGLKVRQPLARLWLALPGGTLGGVADAGFRDELLALLADELNVKAVELIGDGSELVERRVKPLLPVIGRKHGSRIPAIMAACRANEVRILPDGSVELADIVLAPDEVEILATPRPGTAVAHDEGIVVVIDTTLTADLRAEGDARELTRAIQDLRKQAELALDARIDVFLDGDAGALAALEPYLGAVAADTLANAVERGVAPPAGCPEADVELDGGRMRVAIAAASQA